MSLFLRWHDSFQSSAPFNPPIYFLKTTGVNPPISGKAIATPAVITLSVGGTAFQPTHLWEGDCNSRSQNHFPESFSSLVLAKLLKLSLVDPSERLLWWFPDCESHASREVLDFGKPIGVFDLARGLPIKNMEDSSSIGGDWVTTTPVTPSTSKNEEMMHPYFHGMKAWLTSAGGAPMIHLRERILFNAASHPHTNLKLRSVPGWQSVSGQLPGSESRIVTT
jgi:hypothetical protein